MTRLWSSYMLFLSFSSYSETTADKKRKSKAHEVDELLVKSLHSLQENKKAKRDVDEEDHYGELGT